MKILHITDLHISNPHSTGSEALRNAFYPEYLSGLMDKIKQENVDKIFITGDVVDRSRIDNYPHAKAVIEHIADKLDIDSKDIFIVNGNHDVPKDTGDLTEFDSFSAHFDSNKTNIKSGERYKLYLINQKDAVLCIDSIGENYSSGLPGELTQSIVDEIVLKVREEKIDNVFILSHHPAESYSVQSHAPFDENSDWSKGHIWPHGGNLFRRLSNKATINGKAFWFSGDIHRQEHTIIGINRVLVVTGSCNAFEEMTSKIFPQVRVISVSMFEKSQMFEYRFTGHNGKALEGEWELKTSDATRINSPHRKDYEKEDVITNENNAEQQGKDTISLKGEVKSPPQTKKNTLLGLNNKLEKEIYSEIIDNKLYKFGRFDTCESTTALSWISIAPLLDSRAIYKKVINSFKSKIEDINQLIPDKNECLIIGIDHWGAILAARLGAACNIRSCCLAVRGQAGSYDDHEVINDRLSAIVKEKKCIFVVSDVISTGNSLSSTIKTLKTYSSNWYGLSIICDPEQDREGRLDDYNNVFYICGTLKMPTIKTELMPDKGILGTDISFL